MEYAQTTESQNRPKAKFEVDNDVVHEDHIGTVQRVEWNDEHDEWMYEISWHDIDVGDNPSWLLESDLALA